MSEPARCFRRPPATRSWRAGLSAGVLLVSAFLAGSVSVCRAQLEPLPLSLDRPPSDSDFDQPLNDSDQAHLRWLADHAALVFSAKVLSAKRVAAGESLTAADVVFQVESAIRGAPADTLELKFVEEPGRSFLLAPMQRVVLFLHAPNAAGITSVVANNCGLLARTAGDRVDLRHLRFCPSAFAEEHGAKYSAGDEGRFPGRLRHFESTPGASGGETATSIVLEWLRAISGLQAMAGQAVDRSSRAGSAWTRGASSIDVLKTDSLRTRTAQPPAVRLAQ